MALWSGPLGGSHGPDRPARPATSDQLHTIANCRRTRLHLPGARRHPEQQLSASRPDRLRTSAQPRRASADGYDHPILLVRDPLCRLPSLHPDHREGHRMRYAARIALGALAAACVACTGPQIKTAPQPPAEYRTTTIGHGSACGFNLFGVIPIAVNGRAQRAYDEALQTTGGMGLLDVKVTERWYYAVVGNI